MENLEKLDKAVEQLERQSKDLEEFVRIYKLISNLKSEIELSQTKIAENNRKFTDLAEEIQTVLAGQSQSLSNMEDKLLAKVRELYDDNKKYQKELDDTLNTKLEKHKSDIEVTIRNEGTQIQRAFETSLNANFGEMRKELDSQFEEQSKKVKVNTSLLIVVLLIQVATGILIYLH